MHGVAADVVLGVLHRCCLGEEPYSPGSRGHGHEWEFLLRRCTSLYHQGDLRYDGTSQKLGRRGTSWPLLCSTSARWPTCLWCWGSSASSTSLHLSRPAALHTPRMSSRVAVASKRCSWRCS